MQICRPQLVNGIQDDLADRPDMVERTIGVEMATLHEDDQRPEEDFWEEFGAAQAEILGLLYDGVSGALAGYRGVSLEGFGRVRMMDSARWAEAGCVAVGSESGELLTAYVKNQERTMRIAFRQDPVAQAVALLMEWRVKRGEPGALAGECRAVVARADES